MDYASTIAKVTALIAALPEEERSRAAATIGLVFGVGGPQTPSKGTLRMRRYRERNGVTSPPVTRDVTNRHQVTSPTVTCDVTGDVTSSLSLHSPSPSPSESRDLVALSPESDLSGNGGAGARAGVVPLNHVVLCEHFVAGIHGAGCDTYAAPRNEEMRTLGAALSLHCTKAPGQWLETVRALGARWVAYCGGEPDSGLKAKDWLSKGAPAVKQGPRVARILPQPVNPVGRAWKAGDGQ